MSENAESSKILVVDDERGIRDLLVSELEAEGYSVSSAANGVDALALLDKDEFNLVISDIKMPEMDGLELLVKIKRRAPDLEVILATGFGTIETAVAAMKMGAYDYLQKPFNLDEMHNLVKRALEKTNLKTTLALYEASRAVFTIVKLDELLPVLSDISLRALRADDVSILLIGEDKKCSLAAHSGIHAPAHQSAVEILIHETPDELKSEPRILAVRPKEGVISALVSPLTARDEILGFLCATRTKNAVPFSLNDLGMKNVLSSQMSQAIENARLYRSLERKIEDLNDANRVLGEMQARMIQTEKLASLGEMASGVAHELNNPLTAIVGLADLLLLDEKKGTERCEDLTTIKDQSVRCGKIVTNTLQFARQRKSEKKPADLNEIVDSSVELIAYNAKTSSISLEKDYSPSLPKVSVNANQLQQVFINILNNALHALANRPRPALKIRTEHNSQKVRVIFEDNGCGISPKNLEKIFDPFFTTKEVGKGTGLGMSISYGIVHEHGGDIRVESKEGEGARFAVEFPLSKLRYICDIRV